MARPRSVTPEQEDQVRGMAARGEPYRAIGEALGLSAATVSRIVTAPPERAPGVVTTSARPIARRPPPRASEGPPITAEPEPPRPPLQPIVVPEDPREIQRQDWRYYEELKVELRQRARVELERVPPNLRGYRDLLKASREAEGRAAELRPPAAPDPETDPTYRNEARRLVTYLDHLVSAVERGEPVPTRTVPPTEPVAA
jgi:hypothetical protein